MRTSWSSTSTPAASAAGSPVTDGKIVPPDWGRERQPWILQSHPTVLARDALGHPWEATDMLCYMIDTEYQHE